MFGGFKRKESRQTLEVWRFFWWSIADFYAALRIPPTSKISSLPLEIFQSPVSHRYAVLVRFAYEKNQAYFGCLVFLVEHSGLEPLTSTLPVWHSTN